MKEEIIYEEISLEQAMAILPWWGGLGKWVQEVLLHCPLVEVTSLHPSRESSAYVPCFWEGGMVD